MRCAECGEKIDGKPYRQSGIVYCSLECANVAAGIDVNEEEDDYFEEEPIDALYELDEE